MPRGAGGTNKMIQTTNVCRGQVPGQIEDFAWILDAPETGVRIGTPEVQKRWRDRTCNTVTTCQVASSILDSSSLPSKEISHPVSVYSRFAVRLYHPNEPRILTCASLLLCGLVRFFFYEGPEKMPRSPPEFI